MKIQTENFFGILISTRLGDFAHFLLLYIQVSFSKKIITCVLKKTLSIISNPYL